MNLDTKCLSTIAATLSIWCLTLASSHGDMATVLDGVRKEGIPLKLFQI